MKDPEMRILTLELNPEVQATVSHLAELRLRGNKLTGYAIVFEALSLDLGGFVERVARGAVELASDVLATLNHRIDNLLGRTSSGTLAVTIDDVGVAYSIDLPQTSAGRDVRELVTRGDLKGSSFVFEAEAQKWSKVGEKDLRTLTKIRVAELGPVTLPAYPDTSVAMRARTLDGATERARAAADALRRIRQRRAGDALLWRLNGE